MRLLQGGHPCQRLRREALHTHVSGMLPPVCSTSHNECACSPVMGCRDDNFAKAVAQLQEAEVKAKAAGGGGGKVSRGRGRAWGWGWRMGLGLPSLVAL